jgi:hypothetical protein
LDKESAMRNWRLGARAWQLAAAALGVTYFLGGCDPTLQATTQSGIITLSQSVFAAFLRAWVALWQEQVNAANSTTAQAIIDAAQRIIA